MRKIEEVVDEIIEWENRVVTFKPDEKWTTPSKEWTITTILRAYALEIVQRCKGQEIYNGGCPCCGNPEIHDDNCPVYLDRSTLCDAVREEIEGRVGGKR